MDYQKTRVDEPWGSIAPRASFELVGGREGGYEDPQRKILKARLKWWLLKTL